MKNNYHRAICTEGPIYIKMYITSFLLRRVMVSFPLFSFPQTHTTHTNDSEISCKKEVMCYLQII